MTQAPSGHKWRLKRAPVQLRMLGRIADNSITDECVASELVRWQNGGALYCAW